MFVRTLLTGAALLVATHSPAAAAWLEAKSKHFIIYSEQSPEELKAFATRLEKFDLAVRKARGKDDPPLTDSTRLTVYVLPNQQQVGALAGSPGVAGFYIPRVSGPVAFVHRGKQTRDKWDLEAETVFFHEYLHHLMLEDTQLALPHWMTEGYAEFFATAELLPEGGVRFGAVPTYRAQSLLLNQAYAMPFKDMVGANYKGEDGYSVVSVYGLGWLLTHYLTFEPSRRGQATRYAQAIQSGTPALQAARDAFGDLGKLESEVRSYLNRKTLPSVTMPAADLKVDPIVIRPLYAGESAIMNVRIRSTAGVDRKKAPGVAADARRIGASYPRDPAVQSALAEAEHDAKRYAESIAAADLALAADPKNSKALIYKGRSLLELAKKDPAKADWTGIRSWFAKANKVDAEDPEPLVLYYETFKAQNAPVPKVAVDGLEYAQLLVPQDDEVRGLVVRQYLADNQLAKAKQMYATVAYNPHLEGKNRKKVLAIMDAISAGKRAEAISLFDALEAENKKKREG